MVTCPWCGTSYPTFQSNCKNCGGPLSAQAAILPESGGGLLEGHQVADLMAPPPPPRSISNNYVWKLMVTDGWSIASFVFLLMGIIFGFIGLGLIAGIVTAIVGIPFLLIGIAFLAAGGGVVYWRYQETQKVVDVLRWGEALVGQVMDVQENLAVAINNRHPWVIDYQFVCNNQTYTGKVSSLNRPSRQLQPGKPTYVLYHPGNPALNTIYPHP